MCARALHAQKGERGRLRARHPRDVGRVERLGGPKCADVRLRVAGWLVASWNRRVSRATGGWVMRGGGV